MATRIKRYEIEADKLDELLLRIQSEMGPGALIETREFKRGALLGFLGGKRMVEAIATLELENIEALSDTGEMVGVLDAGAADPLDTALESESIRVADAPDPGAGIAYEQAHAGADLATPAYQPPMAVRPQDKMPVALDEVDSLAYALGKLYEHQGSVEEFFAQGVGGHNVSRAAAARAQAVHGLDVEAELAALDAAEASRASSRGEESAVSATPSAEPLTPEERYLAAQALMGEGAPEIPDSYGRSTEWERSSIEQSGGWAADAPAEPVIEADDEFNLPTVEAPEEDFGDDFEDDDLLGSGAGLAMDLAREPVEMLDDTPPTVIEATAEEPQIDVEDAAPEAVTEVEIEAEAESTLEPPVDIAAELLEAEAARAAEAALREDIPHEDGLFDHSIPATVEPDSEPVAAEPILSLPHDVLVPPPAASAPLPSLSILPPEVIKFMEEVKQSINGLQSKVDKLSDTRSEVVDAATQAATQAAQAAVERLLEFEAQRRADDETRRRVEQHRYEEEIAALRAAAEKMSAAAERGDSGVVANPVELDHAASFGAVQRQAYDMLLDWNIGHYDALELLNVALAALEPGAQPTVEGLIATVSEEICRNVLLGDGIRLTRTPPGKAVALVGPTGVGKTTTIAKLAAHFAFQQGKRVSLISMDNYRIAAAEQLRTYADIMGLDLDIVFSKDEFDSVLSRRRSSDLILIDTAGRSPNNPKHLQELREIFTVHPPDEVHLVVAAGTRRDDMKLILEAFKPLSYDHLIVSKLDETRSLGALYNLTRSCTMPISYFAVGQSVPEDIRTATLPFIKQWIAQGRIL